MQEGNYLDVIRRNEGNELFVEKFCDLYKKDKQEGLKVLNDESLTYPSLYLLFAELEKLHILPILSARNKIAYRISNQILFPFESNYGFDYLGTAENRVHQSLKWMLETGCMESYCDGYEKIMDITASSLLSLYEDKTVLGVISDTIFLRNRIGHYNHDLIWAFFRFHNPETLMLIAKRMLDEDEEDSSFACSLLGMEKDENIKTKYSTFVQWLTDNDNYLYFTEESFQLRTNPEMFKVDKERKYLQKPFDGYEKKIMPRLGNTEKTYLTAFNQLKEAEKDVLIKYSDKIHKEDAGKWNAWMSDSIGEQLVIARLKEGDYL